MATKDKEIVAVDSPQESRLVKFTIFDLDANQFSRMQFLADAYARSSFNPRKDNKPQRSKEDYELIMLKGMELGFSPMAAVDNISIIQGKPSVDGKGMLAIAYASDAMEDIKIVGNDETCTVTIKRKGIASPFSFTFTIKDAKAMDLLSKTGSQYLKQPKVMLKWRAVANCLREALPDFLGGLYTKEELAPHDTVVSDGGDMEYQAPLALPATTQGAPDINDIDSALGTTPPHVSDEQRFVLNLIEIISPMCKHDNHARNAIEKAIEENVIVQGDSLDKAAFIMLLRRMKSQWGLTEDESRGILPDALGMTAKDYLVANPRDYAGIWTTLTQRYAEMPE